MSAETSIADLRARYVPKVPGGPILIRQMSGFIEVTEEEVQDAIDAAERLFIRKELGDPPTALEHLALRILVEGWW